jgi:hypothetical protein
VVRRPRQLDEAVELVGGDVLASQDVGLVLLGDHVELVDHVQDDLPRMPGIPVEQLRQGQTFVGLAYPSSGHAMRMAHGRADHGPVATPATGVLRRRGAAHRRYAERSTALRPIGTELLRTRLRAWSIVDLRHGRDYQRREHECADHQRRPSCLTWTEQPSGRRDFSRCRPDGERSRGEIDGQPIGIMCLRSLRMTAHGHH